MFDSPRFKANSELLQSFPSALIEIFHNREGDVQTALQDIEEDHFSVLPCGHLYRSDRAVWSGVWIEQMLDWVDWDDAQLLRDFGVDR